MTSSCTVSNSFGRGARRVLWMAVAAASVVGGQSSLFAINKENNALPLNTGASWVGGIAPGAADTASWEATVLGANTAVLGAPTAWTQLSITNPGGAVTINADGNTLGLGSGGLDMGGATVNFTMNANVNLTAAQTWNIATVATLNGNLSAANAASAALIKAGEGTLILGGANNFAGAGTAATLNLSQGTIKLNSSSAWYHVRESLNNNGVFDINGFSPQLNALLGGGTVTNTAAGSATLTLFSSNGTPTFSGRIENGAGTVAINKLNGGTLVLTGQNTYTGSTVVSRGMLRLDFAPAGLTSDIINAASDLEFNGGVLSLLPNGGAAATQTFNDTRIVSGASALILGPNVTFPALNALGTDLTLNLGAIARTARGGTVNFITATGPTAATGIFTTTGNLSSGILGGWATYNTIDWVAITGGQVQALAPGSYSNTFGANVNTDMTADLTAGANASTGSIRFNNAGATTLTLSGNNKIQTGGILVTATVGANPSGIASTNATDTLTTDGIDLIVHQHNTAGLFTIGSKIVDGTTSVGLTKTGAGTLVLTGQNTYSGTTTINNGVVVLASGATLNPASNILVTRSTNNPAGQILLGDGVNIANNILVAADNQGLGIDVLTGTSATFAGNYSMPVNTLDQYVVGTTGGTLTFTGSHQAGANIPTTQAVVTFIQRGNVIFAGNGNLTSYTAPITLARGNALNLTLKDNASLTVLNLPTGSGIDVGGGQNTNNGVTLTMQDQASINIGLRNFDLHNINNTGANAVTNFNLNGGSITLGGFVKTRNGATQIATLRLNGTTLVATQNNASFLPAFVNDTTSTLIALVGLGGAKVSSNFNNTIATPLLHDPDLTGNDGGLTKSGTGTLTISGASAYNGVTQVNGGRVAFVNAGTNSSFTHAIGALRGEAVEIGATTVVAMGTGSGASKLNTLAIAGVTNTWTGKLDISDNALVVQSSNKALDVARIGNQAASGKAGGTWTGNGITSSSIPGHVNATLAVVDNASLGLGTFAGENVTASSIIVTRAILGDADLSGNVDLGDFDKWFANVSNNTYNYAAGDFDLSGIVDLGDFDIWFSHVGVSTLGVGSAAGVSISGGAAAVPEPASLAVLALGASALLSRRRRR